MYALPPRIDSGIAQVTGVSCPDCSGVLTVRAEGREDSLVFECRILHTYDAAELLAAKEGLLESRLWSAITGFEELVALLDDLATRDSDHGEPAARAYGERAVRAREAAVALRVTISANRPVDLNPTEPELPVDRPGGDSVPGR